MLFDFLKNTSYDLRLFIPELSAHQQYFFTFSSFNKSASKVFWLNFGLE